MKEKTKLKIIHVMSDGTERDSVKGMIVPRTPETEMFYQLLAQSNIRRDKANKIISCTDES